MFTEDELHEARSVSVREIAEKYGAQLRREGREFVGPCTVCGSHDRFSIRLDKNVFNCRGCGTGGGVIDFVTLATGCSFVDAMKALIGKDAGTSARRQPTVEEIAARAAREAERKRGEAEEQTRKESSAAKIIARLQPVMGAPGETYLRDVRLIDVTHWAIKPVLEDVRAIGWCERTHFPQPKPSEPFHELDSQYLGAIVAILTDPITGERTGGISRTFIHEGQKVARAKSLGGVGRLGIVRLSPDDEVGAGLYLCEGLESALSAMMMGFCPMWATGSAATMAKFPILDGVECLTVIADNDVEDAAGKEAGQQAAREVCQRWADAGRQAAMKIPKRPGEDANDILKRRARS
jgi:hypothetical protein